MIPLVPGMSSESVLETVASVMRGRRTIEKFQEKVPPRDVVLWAIELASWAPNHKHTEPWRFHLLGPESAARLVEMNTQIVRRNKGDDVAEKKRDRWSRVPGWLVLSCDVSDDALRAEEDYAACCCAAQNLALALWSRGVGTKWSTGPVTRSDEFARLLGLEPGARRIVGLFSFGYPAAIPQSRRRPVADVTEELP